MIRMTQIQGLWAVAFLLIASSCQSPSKPKPLYQNDAFSVYPDRVEQDSFVAQAISATELVSNYQSPAATFFDPNIEFKFSINGKDNEMSFGQNHHVNLVPNGRDPILVEANFGTPLNLENKQTQSLPQDTKVKFRLNMQPVIKAFAEQGFFTDVHGEKIFKNDFKGVFIAGNAFPLNWDFENLPSNKGLQLKDPDGDGIFEIELTFNTYNSDAHVASQWKLANDLSKYPHFTSSSLLMNAIYNLSLDEMMKNMEADGTFRTGEKWAGVWTRDVSYSIMLSLAMLEPEVAKTSLMKKVKNNRIIQDTGSGGAWPVSSDRVVWALAAWEIYKFTGDQEWLRQSYDIVRLSVLDDQKTIVNSKTGLIMGESSFLDWRKQTYPLWMEPSDIYASQNLGTNAAYAQVLTVLGEMSTLLGENDIWKTKADSLKTAINTHLWEEELGYYGQYLYGRDFQSVSPRSEALGEAFTVLFDIANQERAIEVLENTPVLAYGIPCVYPQTPNISPYHNDAVWPFVQAFWTLAGAKKQHTKLVQQGLGSMLRQAALFLTNKENMVGTNGDFAGTVLNSDRQLWSVAGQLAMNYKVIFGINAQAEKLQFAPIIPKSFRNSYQLSQFKYRQATLNIKVEGYGTTIESFKLDGIEQTTHEIPATLTGNHSIEIIMDNKDKWYQTNMVSNATAPETPILSLNDTILSWTSALESVYYEVYRNGMILQSLSETSMGIQVDQEFAEYQVIAVDQQKMQSFRSNPVYAAPALDVFVIEPEKFVPRYLKKESGFTGTGYIELTREKTAPINIDVTIKEEGTYRIIARYANGSGPVNTDNKCALRSIDINNQFSHVLVMPQRGKDEWSNWGYTNPVNITLPEGKNRITIRMYPFNENMNSAINTALLDQLLLVKVK